ncbi:MAG: AraC family transcriptional regulator [Erysipelotrichaceae bacterium]|jgi:hypothetical protein|nr:AraC family transcriptional regulator [Erysipelotrichaceae bacterium]
MPRIETQENKTLVLKNCIIKELRDIHVDRLEMEINQFLNHLNSLHAQLFGPLITRNYGTHFFDDGSVTESYDVIVQAHDYLNFSRFYKVQEELRAEHCLFAHFDDNPGNMQYAYAKLDLIFYENDLISDGSQYSIFIQREDNRFVLDVFRPVKQL